MGALHSSDPATVFLSSRARVRDFVVGDLERALYEDRTVARVLGMRRTLFVVPTEDVALVQRSSTDHLIERERRRAADLITRADLAEDGAGWLEDVCERVLQALRARGEATAVELTEDVPELGEKLTLYKRDGSLMGTFGVSTRVLFLLATESRIIRARPKGTWLSSLYRWAPIDDWLGGPVPGAVHVDPRH